MLPQWPGCQECALDSFATKRPIWDDRSPSDIGSQGMSIRTLHHYQLGITRSSKVRTGDISSCHEVPGPDSLNWFYHNGTETPSQQGAAVASNHCANSSPQLISPTIAVACFRNQPVFAIYVQILPSDSSMKNKYYDNYQTVANRVQDASTRHAFRKIGLSQRQENRDRLVDFFNFNWLYIINRPLQHSKRHLETWHSNDGRTTYQIYCMSVRSQWIPSVGDCRQHRNANAGNMKGPDCVLVRANLRLRLTTRIKATSSKGFNGRGWTAVMNRRSYFIRQYGRFDRLAEE